MAQNPAAQLKREQNALLQALNKGLDQLSTSIQKERRRVDQLRRRKTITISRDVDLLATMHAQSVSLFKDSETKMAAFIDWVRY